MKTQSKSKVLSVSELAPINALYYDNEKVTFQEFLCLHPGRNHVRVLPGLAPGNKLAFCDNGFYCVNAVPLSAAGRACAKLLVLNAGMLNAIVQHLNHAENDQCAIDIDILVSYANNGETFYTLVPIQFFDKPDLKKLEPFDLAKLTFKVDEEEVEVEDNEKADTDDSEYEDDDDADNEVDEDEDDADDDVDVEDDAEDNVDVDDDEVDVEDDEYDAADDDDADIIEEEIVVVAAESKDTSKKGRGRPPKATSVPTMQKRKAGRSSKEVEPPKNPAKRGRGRPPKVEPNVEPESKGKRSRPSKKAPQETEAPKRGRGRPPKTEKRAALEAKMRSVMKSGKK